MDLVARFEPLGNLDCFLQTLHTHLVVLFGIEIGLQNQEVYSVFAHVLALQLVLSEDLFYFLLILVQSLTLLH